VYNQAEIVRTITTNAFRNTEMKKMSRANMKTLSDDRRESDMEYTSPRVTPVQCLAKDANGVEGNQTGYAKRSIQSCPW
jgi:hypothetical protein